MSTELDWLPIVDASWDARLALARTLPWDEAKPIFVGLANTRLDFARTVKLDRVVSRARQAAGDPRDAASIRLAVLGSSTLAHLLPGIRIAGLRRSLVVECYEGDYGQYVQELADPGSGLHAFAPDVILLAFDARHVAGGDGADAQGALARMRHCWALAQPLGCAVIQQSVMPILAPAMGNNEHRLPGSSPTVIDQVNASLPAAADAAGVHLLSIDAAMRRGGGSDFWYEPGLWYRAKQEVSPRASHLYGEQVGRLLAAIRGLTAKCLVLDLDNTLWGGVIGDDGLDGIVLGQGSGLGEAFLDLQQYALTLQKRGVILAVCSKNDEVNARLPFEQHHEMLLKPHHISCFVANWGDKAQNLRTIAETLNIGLDALVFVDDNPVEQGLIRRELPTVAVPALPDDPADYVRTIARAGYFEALAITGEDRDRAALYAANARRAELRDSVTDMASYLAALRMELIWRPFDRAGLPRIVQLANKTNQFNLTTTRYVDRDIEAAIDDPSALTLQIRLKDIYGDNGVVALVLGRLRDRDLVVETWLMSCRVLGRQVEEATLDLLVDRARDMGAERIVGEYRATPRNAMVRDHYPRLGFAPLDTTDGATHWALDLADYRPRPTTITTIEGSHAAIADLRRA